MAPAGALATKANVAPPSADFSTRYPSSLLALSRQARFTWVPEAAAAASPVGAAGAGGSVGLLNWAVRAYAPMPNASAVAPSAAR